MILVLSQTAQEGTTEEVVDWVRALGGDCVRLNGDDVTSAQPYHLEVDGAGPRFRFHIDGRDFTDRDVRVVWLRRWARTETTAIKPVVGLEVLAGRMNAHLDAEAVAASRSLFATLSRAYWLTRPGDGAVNKLAVLHAAVEAGLEIPATLVTNRREEIERFRREHGRIITKSVGEAQIFPYFNKAYGLYTAEVSEEAVAALPETVLPTLVQALVEKAWEVRAFYLAGSLHAMAIFSQGDRQTELDFRRYNRTRPNRAVPYLVSAELQEKLRALMRALEMDTGSIDLVRTPDGRHVFLEVNPAGQFGMVSHRCNYRLEKKVAEYLIERDRDADA
jgi:ATP-GRASP peptide maturase of grasp-with-spasm system